MGAQLSTESSGDPSVGEPTPELEARCAVHAEAVAAASCKRCGTFLCARCAVPLGNEAVCGTCLGRLVREPAASPQARAAFYLGLVGLITGFLPGIVGLVLAYRELDRLARGEFSLGGRALANAGRLLGWLNVALLGIVALVLLSRWAD
jgi:hypothetical protein